VAGRGHLRGPFGTPGGQPGGRPPPIDAVVNVATVMKVNTPEEVLDGYASLH
jgi:hypothetical protein